MQDYNKKNLYFLLCVFAALAVVFFTFILLTYAENGLWAAPLPLAAEIYGLYHLVKLAIKFKKESEITKEIKFKKD